MYEVVTYRCADPITDIEIFANGAKQALRGLQQVCLSDHPNGDWWYSLNDGCLDVGPFISEQAARDDAIEGTADYAAINGFSYIEAARRAKAVA
jgi:hypothetical protein